MAFPRKKARSDLRIENALLVTKTPKLENGRRCRFSASSEHPPPAKIVSR
jgi:hypothetical protein